MSLLPSGRKYICSRPLWQLNKMITKEKPKYHFDENEHLHLLNGVALTGTSSISNVLSKPLTWWSAELAAVVCLEAGEKIETIRAEYEAAVKSGNKKQAIDELQKKYPIFKQARYAHQATLKEKAKDGTDLHAELEAFVKSEMKLKGDWQWTDRINPFINWADKNVRQFHASEANCFSEKLWLGGVIDAVAELNDGSYAVIDFKSSREAYPGQFIQAALYAIQVDENGLWDKNGKKNKKLDKSVTKLIIVPFGVEKIVPEIRNANDYKAGAEAAVTLYRLLGFEEKVKESQK